MFGSINPERFVEMHYGFDESRGFRSDGTEDLIARFPQYSGSLAKPIIPKVIGNKGGECRMVFSSPFKINDAVCFN